MEIYNLEIRIYTRIDVKRYLIDGSLTLLRRVEGVIFWHVLYIVLQRRLRQDKPFLVDLVHGILEGQLCTAILLVMSEYSTWKSIDVQCVRHDRSEQSGSLNIDFATVGGIRDQDSPFHANILRNCWSCYSFRTKDKCPPIISANRSFTSPIKSHKIILINYQNISFVLFPDIYFKP